MTKNIKKKQKPRIKKPYSNKKYSLCCSMKALSVPKRVYDKCDSPLFIASSLQQRCVMEFNISATEIIRILRCRPVTEIIIYVQWISQSPSKSDSHLPKKLYYLLDLKTFKNHEKCFLFHLKNSFCSQDI